MSFLVYAYRKLALKRQISDKEYRELVVSQQKQSMTDQIGQLQQQISAGKNMFSVFASQANYQATQEVYGKYDGGKVPQAEAGQLQQTLQGKQYEIAYRTNISNSIFEAASQAQMAPMKAIESQLDLEMANLESQLKQLRPELESVEKGETEAAKSEAPKFGLG